MTVAAFALFSVLLVCAFMNAERSHRGVWAFLACVLVAALVVLAVTR